MQRLGPLASRQPVRPPQAEGPWPTVARLSDASHEGWGGLLVASSEQQALVTSRLPGSH